jgi:hypothetical protein
VVESVLVVVASGMVAYALVVKVVVVSVAMVDDLGIAVMSVVIDVVGTAMVVVVAVGVVAIALVVSVVVVAMAVVNDMGVAVMAVDDVPVIVRPTSITPCRTSCVSRSCVIFVM